MKRQGLVTDVRELKKIVKELEEQLDNDKTTFKISGYNTKFQLNIINETGLSDDWRFE